MTSTSSISTVPSPAITTPGVHAALTRKAVPVLMMVIRMKPAGWKGQPVEGHDHCFPENKTTEGSPNVKIGPDGVLALRLGDAVAPHYGSCPKHPTPHCGEVATGSGSVFVNDKPMARQGDTVKCDTGQTAPLLRGQPTVLVGGASVGAGQRRAASPLYRIISVRFLDGDDKTELLRDAKQWVNLPRDDKWVDGTYVTNKDRLSQQPRIKVRFNKPGTHSFKLKYVPGEDNVVYTGGEEGRNANFKYTKEEQSYTTDPDGTKIIDANFSVAAAGMQQYHVVATDENGNEVRSSTLETFRLVYYKEIKMRGLTSIPSSLSTTLAELSNHGIILVDFGSIEMTYFSNVSDVETADGGAFETEVRTAYRGSDAPTKEPYVVGIVYTGHLANKDSNQVVTKSGVSVGPSAADVEIPIIDSSGKDKFLWINLVPGENWFVSAKFLGDGGAAGTEDVVIAEADCTAVPDPDAPDVSRTVRVKVTGLPAATGTITLTVNWVKTMRAGLQFPKTNLVCVNTRSWFKDKATDVMNATLIHEMGHKFEMVPEGTGKQPDKTATMYTGKGHVGPHCHQGFSASLSTYVGLKGNPCVMFGITNGKTTFCTNCAPALKKQDFSEGWSGNW